MNQALLAMLFCASTVVPVEVLTSEQPPFIIKADTTSGVYETGYAIDIWKQVIAESGISARLPYKMNSGKEKRNRVQKYSGQVGLGGNSITKNREKTLNFTYPIYRSGQGMMYQPSPLFTRIINGMDGIVLWFLALVLVSGHFIWILERGKSFDLNYFKGVFEGMYWAIVTASTVGYGDKAPTTMVGRTLAGVLIVISLPMFGMFTAAAFNVVNSDVSSVVHPSDIDGKFAVVEGSTGEVYVIRNSLKYRSFESIYAAEKALSEGKVNVILYDAPTLQWIAKKSDGLYEVSAHTFDKQYLSFALNEQDTELLEKINRVLVGMEESGELSRLQVKWFGVAQ